MIRPRSALRSIAVLACLLSSSAVWADTSGPKADTSGPKQVTSVEGITEYELANGLHVLLFPEPSKPTITVNITYLVGSRYEGYGETGMAHLLEHMLFKGSTNHRNIPQELTSHGARPNGTTSYDRTNYFETFAATDDNLRWALDLEADRMVHSFVAKKDLDTEMTVVRNEYEMGENSPESILAERTLSTAFLWHNYGKSTIGARSDIENVPIEHLQAFYRKYYQPDNAVLVVAGKFDPAKTLALINQTFSPIPQPTRELDRTYTREPTQDGERSVTLRRVGDMQVVSAAYHVPSGSHPDAAALSILGEVLGNAPTGRLYKALVEKKKAASVSAWFWSLAEPGVIYAEATVRENGSLPAAQSAFLATLDDVVKHPPTSAEIEQARADLLKNIELSLTNAESVGLALSEWIAKGDWRLYFLYRDRIRKVTPADVARVAAAYLKPSNRTVGLFMPTKSPDRAEVPEAPPVEEQLKGYKGDAAIAAGEAFDPSPENIDARTTRTTLPVGLKLALLSKKTRGQRINAALTIRLGDEKHLRNLGQIPSFTATMLQRGTTKHTREQLRDELDRLKARVSINNAGAGQVRVSIETIRANFPAVLGLVAEMLQKPAFPATEVERLRQEWLVNVEQRKSDPQSIAWNAFSRYLSPYQKGDCRYTPTDDEEISEVSSVKREQLVRFHDEFYGASFGQLAVVGDFDPAAVTKLATDLFGKWKSRDSYTRVPSLYFDTTPKALSFETPDKENAVFLWGMNLQLRDDDPDYAAMVLGNYLLGGGFLNSRLATRIRQKEGISYGVGSWFYASPVDKVAGFGAQAIYAPQNVDRLAKAFNEELARVLKDGFTADEVAAAKSGWLQTRQVTRAQDGSVASTLTDDLYLGRTYDWDKKLEARVAALTPDEIKAALDRHLSADKLCQVKAGDFARATAAKAASTKGQ